MQVLVPDGSMLLPKGIFYLRPSRRTHGEKVEEKQGL